MGKNSTPQYNPPAPPTLKSASDIYGSATDYAKTNMPNAFGARESALSDLSKGNSYYEGFQPTSFESALGNKYFQNVWPDTQESILHGLSLSGLDSSPLVASQLGKARGGLETQIGQYLSDQGNNRAQYSLNSRLGIDPNQVTSPYVQTDTNQSNSQSQLNYDYQQQLAQAQYQQAVEKYNQQQALYKAIGTISPLGGPIYGAINGGGQGFASGLSGTMQTAQMALPLMMGGMGATGGMGAAGGLGGMFGSGTTPYSASMSSPVNPYSMSSGLNNYMHGGMPGVMP